MIYEGVVQLVNPVLLGKDSLFPGDYIVLDGNLAVVSDNQTITTQHDQKRHVINEQLVLRLGELVVTLANLPIEQTIVYALRRSNWEYVLTHNLHQSKSPVKFFLAKVPQQDSSVVIATLILYKKPYIYTIQDVKYLLKSLAKTIHESKDDSSFLPDEAFVEDWFKKNRNIPPIF